MAENEINVLVKFAADLGNLNSALGAVKTQFNQLTLGNAKLSQVTGQALPELSQQLSVLKVLGAQGDKTAASMVNLAQGTKTFYSVFSGNAKQNLASLFRSNIATKQTISSLGSELKNVQVISQKTGASMTSFADDWAMKTRTMASVYVESLHRHAVAWVTAGKQLQWVGRQMIVGITAPIAALTYVFGKAAIEISRAETQLGLFLQTTNKSAEETAAIVQNELSPAFRKLGEDLGITWAETENMAASWAAAGYSAKNLIVPVTQLTEELATLAQGDIDVAQAQELVRNINATYYEATAKGIQQTRKQVEALQVIQSTTALQMKDIVNSLPIVTQIGKQMGLNATELTAMIAGMRQLGIDANIAGTALRNSFSQLAKPSDVAAELFKKTFGTGIEDIIYGPGGQARGLAAIEQLANMFTKLNDAQRNELTTALFGSRQAARMNALFDSMVNTQSDYNSALRDTSNSTANATFWNKQLESVMSSLAKTWDQIKVKLGNVAASIGKTLLPQIEGLADAFVNMAQGLDNLLTRFPELASWLVKIAGLAAALGPAIFALGQFKLLFGSIGTGITGLGRQIFKVTSAEAPTALTSAIAANPGNLPLALAGGLPTPMLGAGAAGAGDYQKAISALGLGIAGPGAGANPLRAIAGQSLAAQRLGGGQVGNAMFSSMAGWETPILAKAVTGATMNPDELSKAVNYFREINGGFLTEVQGNTLDELRRAHSDALDSLFKSGKLKYIQSGTGASLMAGNRFVGAEGVKKLIQDQMDEQWLSQALGVGVSATAGGVSAGNIDNLVTGNVQAASEAIKKETAKNKTGLSWIMQLMAGKPEAAALKDVEVAGEKTATTFMGKIRSGISTAGKKGGSILDIFSDKKATVLTSSEKGFATIAMQFTSILPELILLVGAAVVVFKNWESIWAGLEAPMQMVMDLLKQIGQIWAEAFNNIFGTQNGNGINEFWKQLGQEIGNVAVQITEFIKLLSTGLAPTIAWIVKTVLQAVEAFISLFSIITTGTAGLREFISGGTSVAAKIVAIITVVILATKAIRALYVAFLELRTAQTVMSGIAAALSSLGTLGIVAIVAGIATVFSLLTQKSQEAQQAIENASSAVDSFRTSFGTFLAEAKKQGMEEFTASSRILVTSMTDVVDKIIEARQLSGDWANNATDVKDVMSSMEPIMENLNKLSRDQLITFEKMVEQKANELRIQELLLEAQIAATENQIIAEAQQRTGTTATTAQLQALLQVYNQFKGNKILALANAGNLGLDPGTISALLDSIEQHSGALQPLLDDQTSLNAQIKIFSQYLPSYIQGLANLKPSSSLGEMSAAIDQARLKVAALGNAGQTAGDKLKEAAKAAKEAFQSAYESQLAQTTDRVTSAILDAFDKQTQAMTDAIDKQIEAINKQNEKEEWLQQQREYRQERLKMLYDSQISLATNAAERQKALNEGRYDDARLLELQALQLQSDQNKALDDLDKQHQQSVKDHNQQNKIDQLNKEKEHLQKVRDEMRTRLANILSEVTEFGARTKAEWLEMYAKMNGVAGTYGLKIQQTAHSFFQSWGHTINADLQDAFHDAQIAAAREAEKTGKAVADGFQEGLTKSQGFKLLAEAGKIWNKLQTMTTAAAHIAHGDPTANFSDLTSTKKYQTLSTQFWNIMDKISGQSKHTGGEITGQKKSDVPIMAQEGEFVIRRDVVNRIGAKNLHKINKMYHDGGIVSGTREQMRTGTGAALSLLGGGTSGMLAGVGNVFQKGVGAQLRVMADTLRQQQGMGANAAGGTLYPGAPNVQGGRNGATPAMTTLYDWIVSHTGVGGTLGVGHLTTGSVGYSQHAYGNAVDFFGDAQTMMSGFLTLVKNATGALKGILGHVIHAGKKWSWNGGYGTYYPPPGTSDLHYGHIHADAIPLYGGTPPGYPLPQSQWYRKGGLVRRTGDRVHAGEFVLRPDAVKRIGINNLNKINFASPRFSAEELRFSAPNFLGMPRPGSQANQGGDVIIKVNIDQFFGDDGSYRKLYDTLERVGSKVARERGFGNTIIKY